MPNDPINISALSGPPKSNLQKKFYFLLFTAVMSHSSQQEILWKVLKSDITKNSNFFPKMNIIYPLFKQQLYVGEI